MVVVLSTLACMAHVATSYPTLTEQGDVTHYSFQMFWSATSELEFNVEVIPEPTFTIHGLWPDHDSKPYLEHCSSTPFDKDALGNDLESEMTKVWPNYVPEKTDDDFWGHEWSTHGTCAVKYSSETGISSEKEYFQAALNWGTSPDHSLLNILKNNGIVPSNSVSYDAKQVQTALQNGLKVTNFSINCYQKDGKSYISAIGYCINLNLSQIIDCNEDWVLSSSCLESVYLPAKQSS